MHVYSGLVFVGGVGERLSDTMCLITYKREHSLDLAIGPEYI